jgi:uncharacterized protein
LAFSTASRAGAHGTLYGLRFHQRPTLEHDKSAPQSPKLPKAWATRTHIILIDEELLMLRGEYAVFEALDPFFDIIQQGLSGLVDGEHFFDTIADNAIFEFRYHFPGWPLTIRGRADLMASYAGYGKSIRLHSGDSLIVHRSQDRRVVILEYEVHGKILSTGARYDNRFVSIITIEKKKIVHWRDYMDSLAAWTALNPAS